MEYSKQFNRDLKNLENQYFDAYMQAHPSQEFVNTQSGFKMTKTQLGEKKYSRQRYNCLYLCHKRFAG